MTRLALPGCSRLDLSFSSLLDAAAGKPATGMIRLRRQHAYLVRDRKVVFAAEVRHNFDSNEG